VITTVQRRRRWSAAEKAALVRCTYEPGMSVSLVARPEGISAGLLFNWRRLEPQGALTAVSAAEEVVPASELAAARAEIAKLQRILGKRRACWSDGKARVLDDSELVAEAASSSPSCPATSFLMYPSSAGLTKPPTTPIELTRPMPKAAVSRRR
jgi:transposase-like protein